MKLTQYIFTFNGLLPVRLGGGHSTRLHPLDYVSDWRTCPHSDLYYQQPPCHKPDKMLHYRRIHDNGY